MMVLPLTRGRLHGDDAPQEQTVQVQDFRLCSQGSTLHNTPHRKRPGDNVIKLFTAVGYEFS